MSVFSGSYHADDVVFLLKPIDFPHVSIEQKERLIQSGEYHYSQLLSEELPHDEFRQNEFFQTCFRNSEYIANGIFYLAHYINMLHKGQIVLISLVRAGTPIGALLCRCLKRFFGRRVFHYSISIIRDRGIDKNAIRWILDRHASEDIHFIDGWSAKGSIALELKKSIFEINEEWNTNISHKLFVLNDLCGNADVSFSLADTLIPSAMLNSTVSGLVSRSILDDRFIGPNDFHGVVFYSQFLRYDLSNWFLDEIFKKIEFLELKNKLLSCPTYICCMDSDKNNSLFDIRRKYIHTLADNIPSNRIKPGICESIRAILRRNWNYLLINNQSNIDLQPILRLAKIKNMKVIENGVLPFQAISISDTPK